MAKKPVAIGDTLVKLATPGAELYIIQNRPYIFIRGKQLLVNKPVLERLKELEVIEPFKESTPLGMRTTLLVSGISEKGREHAARYREDCVRYHQLELEYYGPVPEN